MIASVPPKRLTPTARWSRARQAATIAVLLCGAALVDPDHPLPIDLCLWKRLSGWPCPTCGLTRAVCHALRGDWSTSLTLHPAGLLVLAGLAGWAAWLALEAWRGRPIHEAARETVLAAMLRVGVAVSILAWIKTNAFL